MYVCRIRWVCLAHKQRENLHGRDNGSIVEVAVLKYCVVIPQQASLYVLLCYVPITPESHFKTWLRRANRPSVVEKYAKNSRCNPVPTDDERKTIYGL